MDKSNMEKASRYLFLRIPRTGFVPVPATPAPSRKPVAAEHSEFKFCWIGRLCDFKAYILMYTIQRLSKLSRENRLAIRYYVVGNGPFEQMIRSLDVSHEYFHLDMKGAMQPDELDQFIYDEIDVVTAMGTSALEAAKFGVPAILLDISYYPVKGDYRFRWLHDTVDFDLAHDITRDDLEEGNTSLSDMLRSLREDYTGLSEKSYRYFMQHHHIQAVCNTFLERVAASSLHFSDIDPRILQRSFLRKMYDKARGFN